LSRLHIRLSLDDDDVDDAEECMSIPHQDVAEARRAVDALSAAVARLTRTGGQSLDLRRLAEDIGRVKIDLELVAGEITGADAAASDTGSPGAVRDVGYDPREFVDGTYEGTTPHQR
jgi:hypothetical protein